MISANKYAKEMHTHFSKGNIQIDLMNIYSMTLSLGKFKLKQHTIIHTHPKRQILPSAGKGIEKVESLDIFGKNIIWYLYLGKLSDNFLNS